jgi:hypothetical protein
VAHVHAVLAAHVDVFGCVAWIALFYALEQTWRTRREAAFLKIFAAIALVGLADAANLHLWLAPRLAPLLGPPPLDHMRSLQLAKLLAAAGITILAGLLLLEARALGGHSARTAEQMLGLLGMLAVWDVSLEIVQMSSAPGRPLWAIAEEAGELVLVLLATCLVLALQPSAARAGSQQPPGDGAR